MLQLIWPTHLYVIPLVLDSLKLRGHWLHVFQCVLVCLKPDQHLLQLILEGDSLLQRHIQILGPLLHLLRLKMYSFSGTLI